MEGEGSRYGEEERGNSRGGSAVQQLAAPLYKGAMKGITSGAVQLYMN